MLEIFLVIFLCKKNAANAYQRGASEGLYKLITVLLWFGGEIMGMIIGFGLGLGKAGAYLIAIICAAAGAFLANYLSKRAN